MRKLRLNIEALAVESFATGRSPRGGTVAAHSGVTGALLECGTGYGCVEGGDSLEACGGEGATDVYTCQQTCRCTRAATYCQDATCAATCGIRHTCQGSCLAGCTWACE